MSHVVIAPFVHFLGWTLDQKIQTFILSVLLLTLGWAMLVEIPKMRKRILFLELEAHKYSNTNGGWVEITFSNHCRRVLKRVYISEIKTVNRSAFDTGFIRAAEDMHEGDMRVLQAYYTEFIEKINIRKVVLRDSVNKRYIGYVYCGEFRKRWIAYILYAKDWLVSLISP